MRTLRRFGTTLAMACALGAVLAGAADPTMPDPKMAPGAVNPNITKAEICNPKFSTSTIRPPASATTKLKKAQMEKLGYTVPNKLPNVKTASGKGTRPDLTKCVKNSGNPACWEEDHLISLELGGDPGFVKKNGHWVATSGDNLWPEPWFGENNAHKKDVLENTLHRLVCDGAVPLGMAQKAIADDWVAAYGKYVKGKE